MFELNICHLYPDLLNLYGDKGNVTALKMRAEWQGINTTVMNVSIGDC
ncbi:MAG TPA: glutamine amidotransferase, partial [Clostridia bacterium]|nr:glutamine amidotransferase [Clostridia bacterium]